MLRLILFIMFNVFLEDPFYNSVFMSLASCFFTNLVLEYSVLSAMIRGAADGKQLVVKDYKGDEAKKLIKDFLKANDLL